MKEAEVKWRVQILGAARETGSVLHFMSSAAHSDKTTRNFVLDLGFLGGLDQLNVVNGSQLTFT